MTNAISVKDRLKRQALEDGKTMQDNLVTFVSLGLANSRYKDFYDIYILADRYDLDGTELKGAIVATFRHRKTGFDDIIAFAPDFTEDVIRQNRWNAFIKKKRALIQVKFEETMALVKALLMPVVSSIQNDTAFEKSWDKESKSWH